jgi:hypothetical protein
VITGFLVNVARRHALGGVRAALGLEGARAAVVSACRIALHVARENAGRHPFEISCLRKTKYQADNSVISKRDPFITTRYL